MNIPKRNLNFGSSISAFVPCDSNINDDEQPVLSPMTELAVNFELSSMSTPRRKLALSESSSPDSERSCDRRSSITDSLESGIEAGSPALSECPADFESPMVAVIRTRKLSGPYNNNSLRRQLARRSFSSPVLPRKPLESLNSYDAENVFPKKTKSVNSDHLSTKTTTPTTTVEHVEENHSDLSLCEMSDQFPELEDSCFQIKRRKYTGRSFSAPTFSSESLDIYDSGSSSSCFSTDDGFFDELSNVETDGSISSCAPTNFLGLIKAPIVSSRRNSPENKENFIPVKENDGFQKPVSHLPYRSRSCSLPVKRESPATNSPSPCTRKKRARQVYRSKSFYDSNPLLCPIEKRLEIPTPIRALQRSQSFDIKHAKPASIDITSLLDKDDKNLIGDKTKEYCLPTVASKHPDLKAITPETLSKLINGDYEDVVDKFHIIDSRYPYEYEGGHIKGALNIFEKEDLTIQFLKNAPKCKEERQILVFHCEFSSKRGPAMCRFLRNKDRDIHQNSYPNLFYPEMYLLEGGYKEYYKQQKESCEPQAYREMLDPAYQQDLKLFSKRSKSWSEDKSSHRRRVGMRY